MNEHLDDRYIRTDDFQSRVEGLEFTPQIWAIFAKIEQPRSVSEIAAELKLPTDTVDAAFRSLLGCKLIKKKVLSWSDFASGSTPASPSSPGAKSTPSSPATPAPEAPRSSLPSLAPFTAAAPAPSGPGAPAIFLRLASEKSIRAISTPVVHLRLARADLPKAAASAGCKLRPILDAISKSVGGGVPGQLLVYKIFLQLPPDLLKAAGLHSLGAVTEETTITDPALRTALIDSAKQHAHIDVAPLAEAA